MKLALLKTHVNVFGFTGYLFSGKLVKTILIRSIPRLEELFKPTAGSMPKLIHISPLYRVKNDGEIECVYSYAVCRETSAYVKCVDALKPITLNGRYHFHIGFHQSVEKVTDVLNALLNYSECFEFMNQKVCVEIAEIEAWNAVELGRNLAIRVMNSGGLKLVFASPTMPRDPFRTSGKYKAYLPTPEIVFATPVYAKQIANGEYTIKKFRRELLYLRRLFHETYSVWGSIRVRWVYYGRRPEPALIGYVNYRVNYEYLDFLKQGLNVEEWLGEVFAYTLALGVGAGRATGFGH
ncbi:MAG: CRISPR system precrRNA processing endoribonuclease RAMP protein Cas6, partial [Desulfurococcaceae archaeon]